MLLTVLILLLTIVSDADEYHYRDILIGERAAGLGGAFIAISDDPSGLFHNPAGIIFSFEDYFSASANAYVISTKTYKNVFPNSDYSYKSSGLVPTFFGFTQSYDRYKWGFIIAVPNSDQLDQEDVLENLFTGVDKTKDFERKFFRQNTSTYIGPGIAAELKKNLTVGISTLIVNRIDKRIDDQFMTFNTATPGQTKYNMQSITASMNNLSLYAKFGMQYMPAPKFSLGFTAAKSIPISGELKARQIARSPIDPAVPTDTGTVPGTFENDITDGKRLKATIKTQDPSPLELGFGFAYFPNKIYLIAADLLYYGSDSTYKKTAGFEIQPTINFSVGGEIYLSPTVAIRLGLFSNNANTPKLVQGKKNQPDHVDLLGTSISVSMIKPSSSFTIGTTYMKGSGKGQPINESTTQMTINQDSIALFITGSYQL